MTKISVLSNIRDCLPMFVRRAIRVLRTSFFHLKVAKHLLSWDQRFRFMVRGLPLSFRERLFNFPLKNSNHKIYLRSNSSDMTVFSQVFHDREYASLLDSSNVTTIIDLGANIGLSSVWFLTHFPNASVLAVEPDEENFEVLKKNIAAFGDRAQAIRAGVWSDETWLKMSERTYRDGQHWARQVVECNENEPSAFRAVSLPGLMKRLNASRISILKVDIEGAEAKVFEAASKNWLGQIDTIAIELHEDSLFGPCSNIFHAAIAEQGFNVSTCGELTICKRA